MTIMYSLDVTNTSEAHSITLEAGKAMAHTCIDVLMTDGLLQDVQAAFKVQMENLNN